MHSFKQRLGRNSFNVGPIKTISLLSLSLLIIFGFSFSDNNDEKELKWKKLPKDLKHFSYIPSGTVDVDGPDQTITGFYMSSTEVSNKEYKIFLDDIKENGTPEQLEIAKVKEEAWNELNGEMEPMVKNYFTNEVYEDYPVVNVSYEAVKLYCEWMTEKHGKLKGGGEIVFQIPTRAEWEHAAKGGNPSNLYPWGGPNCVNKKGCFLANFQPEKDKHALDGVLITAKCDSYFPNDYGLYNMSGNVAEFVEGNHYIGGGFLKGGSWISSSEELKISNSAIQATEAHPTRGFRPIIRMNH